MRTILEGAAGGIRGGLAACVVDSDRLALGGEEGLSCVDLECGEIMRCPAPDSKRIHRMEYIAEEQLLGRLLHSIFCCPTDGLQY